MTQHNHSNPASDIFLGAIFLNGRDKAMEIVSCLVETVDNEAEQERGYNPLSMSVCDTGKNRHNFVLDTPDKVTQLAKISAVNYALCTASKHPERVAHQPSTGREYRTVMVGQYDSNLQINKMFSQIGGSSQLQVKQPFAERVRDKVFDKLSGNYSVGFYTLGDSPFFALASKGNVQPIVLQLVLTRTALALVWADSFKTMNAFKYNLKTSYPDSWPLFVESLVLSNSMTLLNPIHLSSKWRNGISRGIQINQPLIVLNILNKHLQKQRYNIALNEELDPRYTNEG